MRVVDTESGTVSDGSGPSSFPLLELEQVVVGYGAAPVLHGVCLRVDVQEIVCLLGGNAAGKSTTMKTIVGVLPLLGGSVRLDGVSLAGLAPSDVVRRGVAIVPEGRRIFPRLTVAENLDLGAYGRRDSSSDVALDLESIFSLFPRLAERRTQLGGTLSGGEQQMLAIGRALMARPRLLLLDEPSMGLAPVLVDRVFEVIAEIHRRGTAVFLIEQNARMALEIADRGYLLRQGRIVSEGRSEELLASDTVREAYLGD